MVGQLFHSPYLPCSDNIVVVPSIAIEVMLRMRSSMRMPSKSLTHENLCACTATSGSRSASSTVAPWSVGPRQRWWVVLQKFLYRAVDSSYAAPLSWWHWLTCCDVSATDDCMKTHKLCTLQAGDILRWLKVPGSPASGGWIVHDGVACMVSCRFQAIKLHLQGFFHGNERIWLWYCSVLNKSSTPTNSWMSRGKEKKAT